MGFFLFSVIGIEIKNGVVTVVAIGILVTVKRKGRQRFTNS